MRLLASCAAAVGDALCAVDAFVTSIKIGLEVVLGIPHPQEMIEDFGSLEVVKRFRCLLAKV